MNKHLTCKRRGTESSRKLVQMGPLEVTKPVLCLAAARWMLLLMLQQLCPNIQVVLNTMALCPPDGKIQMERSVVHREMIIEFTTRERCQIEGSGKHSPLFNHGIGKEWEQPCKPPPQLPP
ncbi:uncharacterized protein LJ264_005434 [Porphyrio hochstetteri]